MNKKTYEKIKKRNIYIDEKIISYKVKIEEIQLLIEKLENEKKDNEFLILNETLSALELKPQYILEKIFEGKNKKEIYETLLKKYDSDIQKEENNQGDIANEN